jgi:hypothetical protein
MNASSSLSPRSRVKPLRYLLSVLATGAITAAVCQVPVAPAKPAGYTRLVRHDKTQMDLQTRAARFVPESGKGPAVWLVGAAHVGEASYYESIQKLLDAQDLVLYERVNKAKPANNEKQPDTKATYQVLSDGLGLQFQLLAIHYDRPSFRNSDLSWEQLTDLAAKQGNGAKESLAGIEKILDPSSPQSKMLVSLMASVKADPGLGAGLRVVMAETLAGQVGLQGSPVAAAEDVVINARNEKVFKDLDEEIGKPTTAKSIAIFYGAGHLSDMEKRLAQRHYKLAESQWMTALKADESKATGAGKMMVDMFRQQRAAQKSGKGG